VEQLLDYSDRQVMNVRIRRLRNDAFTVECDEVTDTLLTAITRSVPFVTYTIIP
jgi:hypothetical protein